MQKTVIDKLSKKIDKVSEKTIYKEKRYIKSFQTNDSAYSIKDEMC